MASVRPLTPVRRREPVVWAKPAVLPPERYIRFAPLEGVIAIMAKDESSMRELRIMRLAFADGNGCSTAETSVWISAIPAADPRRVK